MTEKEKGRVRTVQVGGMQFIYSKVLSEPTMAFLESEWTDEECKAVQPIEGCLCWAMRMGRVGRRAGRSEGVLY